MSTPEQQQVVDTFGAELDEVAARLASFPQSTERDDAQVALEKVRVLGLVAIDTTVGLPVAEPVEDVEVVEEPEPTPVVEPTAPVEPEPDQPTPADVPAAAVPDADVANPEVTPVAPAEDAETVEEPAAP